MSPGAVATRCHIGNIGTLCLSSTVTGTGNSHRTIDQRAQQNKLTRKRAQHSIDAMMPKDIEKFWELEDVLSGNVNGQIQDYNMIRIKLERVGRPHPQLWHRHH
jgi:hypothetical protein